ncbi:MAG: bifunctional methionine sulfoxide reductase B/A protein [Candidatus Eisenbacteria bacterium]|nr:bifunctional methionine sulfoxide reductase B/A protein [Candidatus Eisenbacteria bacterium]
MTSEELSAAREGLTHEQESIAFHAGTEAPFCGLYTDTEEPGIYVSVVSGLPLFRSDAKFHSASGWASFFEPFDPAHVLERPDHSHGMQRVEILDARSGTHLGHVFEDGPPPTGKRYCLNSAVLRFIPQGEPLPPESRPVEFQTAYFAGGCFWGIEDRFARVPGVVDAVSGYMGGAVASPSYRQVCRGETGHAETVKVVFDPNRVSYWKLLGAFFSMHDPTTRNRQGPDVGTQYRSAIFTANADQEREARDFVRDLAGSGRFGGREIVTEIAPAETFYEAEEYHQDYHARHGGSCGF